MRKKVHGFFSDKSKGHGITELCVLRAKSYAYKIEGVKKLKLRVSEVMWLETIWHLRIIRGVCLRKMT